MKATIEKPQVLLSVCKFLKNFDVEAEFSFLKTKIEVFIPDKSNVTMAKITIPISIATKYEANGEKLNINVDDFVKVLSTIKEKNSCEIENTEALLKIKIRDLLTFSNYEIPLMEKESKLSGMEWKDLEYDTSFLVPPKEFIEILDNLTKFDTNSIHFDAKGEKLTVTTESDKNRKCKSELKIESKKDSLGRYSPKFVKYISEIAKNSETMQLNFSTDYPICIVCDKKNEFRVQQIVAPRVDND